MTKLEAWQAWCTTAGTERLADQFTLENSSHGKAFSFAWDAAHEACAKVCEERDVTGECYVEGSAESRGCAEAIRARSNT